MKKVFLVFTVLCLSMSCTKETIIEGAAGADGRDGIDGQDGASITATVIDLAIGSEECPNGGSIVTLFADGIQFDEIITCNGIDGQDGADGSYSIMTSNPYFVNNVLVGETIEYGIDDNGNGILDEDEVDGRYNILNGVDGVDGADGADGVDGADGADGVDGQDGADATGAELYDFSGTYLHESGLYSLDVSNIRFVPNSVNGGRYTFDITSNGQTVEAYFELENANTNELVVDGIISFGTTYLALPHYQYETIVFGGQIRDIATDNILDGGAFIKQ